MDGHYYLDTYLDSWDRYMNDLTEEEQNRLWDEQMYGRNGHNPPVVKTAKQERTDENGGQPVECPQCGSYNESRAKTAVIFVGFVNTSGKRRKS